MLHAYSSFLATPDAKQVSGSTPVPCISPHLHCHLPYGRPVVCCHTLQHLQLSTLNINLQQVNAPAAIAAAAA